MTFDIDTIETAVQSVTATVCENAALYGAAPERDEFDSREVWDADDATDAVSEAFRVLAEDVAPDGYQLADERESLLWGFVNMLDAQVRRLDRSVDRLSPELRDLQRAQDGTEIKSRELELVTDRARNRSASRAASSSPATGRGGAVRFNSRRRCCGGNTVLARASRRARRRHCRSRERSSLRSRLPAWRSPRPALASIIVTALPTSPPSPRSTLRRMAVSAPAATQTPWRLRSAVLDGEDSP